MLFAIGGAILTMTVPVWTLMHGKQDGARLKRYAASAVAFGLARFDSIDSDGNKLLSESELERASNSLFARSTEIRFLKDRCAEIGHVVDSKTVFKRVYRPGRVGQYVPIARTQYFYAISRADLQSYESRIARRYRHW
jgi:hypothetical protein